MGRLSHSACILRLKRWLLAGLNDAELSVQNARSDHVAMGGPGLQAFAEGPSEEEMDEKIRKFDNILPQVFESFEVTFRFIVSDVV